MRPTSGLGLRLDIEPQSTIVIAFDSRRTRKCITNRPPSVIAADQHWSAFRALRSTQMRRRPRSGWGGRTSTRRPPPALGGTPRPKATDPSGRASALDRHTRRPVAVAGTIYLMARSKPGIRPVHRRGCAAREGGRCTCRPTWLADVRVAPGPKGRLRRNFPTEAAAAGWRIDMLSAKRQGQTFVLSSRTPRARAPSIGGTDRGIRYYPVWATRFAGHCDRASNG